MTGKFSINIDKVERSLRDVQKNFNEINTTLDMRRETLRDEIIDNIIEGYKYVNMLLDWDINLLEKEGFRHFVELNHIVLCGTDETRRKNYKQHIEMTTSRFYEQQEFSIAHLYSWAKKHKHDSAWKQASGAYILQLSWPQLFAEGNHRTGALLMSLLLVRLGKPPFVLSIDNAKGYFDPSSLAKSTHKNNMLGKLYKLPKITKKFAEFMKEHTKRDFLQPL